MVVNDDFIPKRSKDLRLPPGQYEVKDFPVLSLGPTPEVDVDKWFLEITGLVSKPIKINLEELKKREVEKITKDIHCVTKWSKFDTSWQGISLDSLMKEAEVSNSAKFLIAHSSDGYTTNIPIEDVSNNRAWVVFSFEGKPIDKEHGGPVRLLIPHLYFWKSAKWLTKLEFINEDSPGFWEVRGYHNYGDPWREQRYSFDQ